MPVGGVDVTVTACLCLLVVYGISLSMFVCPPVGLSVCMYVCPVLYILLNCHYLSDVAKSTCHFSSTILH